MLAQQSYYPDHRSGPVLNASMSYTSPPRSTTPRSKKEKIKFVSKTSLAIFDPRHAMGIETGHEWYESPSYVYGNRESLEDDEQLLHRSTSASSGPHHASHAGRGWSASPTPELDAFTGSMEDYMSSSATKAASASGAVEMTRQTSASSSVFEDDRDTQEPLPARKRFLSRKSTAPVVSALDDLVSSPPSATSKGKTAAKSPYGGAPLTNPATSSSIARFFAWKKKEKQSSLPLATKSTSDLFDAVPQSAPPTTLAFDRSFQTIRERKDSDPSAVFGSPSSLPSSPVRTPVRLPQNTSPTNTSPLSPKKSMPALRQIREAHNRRDIRSATKAPDGPPALPPLPNFEASPMIPLEYSWCIKTGTNRESHLPASSSASSSIGSSSAGAGNARPVSRYVSSTGRGVPSPGLNPQRGYDTRKSTITLRDEPLLRFDETGKPQPPAGTRRAPRANKGSEKRLSMAQKVVDGQLPQNRGREEPEMRFERTDMQVKAVRRRSRSVDGRAQASSTSHVTSPPSSNSHSDSVFPAFMRHAPRAGARSPSPQTIRFADTEQNDGSTPTQRQMSAFSAPSAASSRGHQVRTQAATGETHQARRVNLSNQRVRAVAVASPLLLSRSPRMGGGQTMPLPVVNIMPPTPDMAGDAQVQDRREQVVEAYQQAAAPIRGAASGTAAAKPVQAGAVAPKVAKEIQRQPVHVATVTSKAPAPAPVTAPEPAAVNVKSPESVYSPSSIYSPETVDGRFSTAYEGIVDILAKDVTVDAVSITTFNTMHLPRSESLDSEVSEASTGVSSSSSAELFGFSRTESTSSMASGGTYSSASSVASESPERSLRKLSSLASFDFSPTKMASSVSLASTADTSISMLDFGSADEDAVGAPNQSAEVAKLKTPFQLQTPASRAGASTPSDSGDCETPTLASCREMSATAATKPSSQKLGLDMDLSDLAQELGLGRLSQIGLSHLKQVQPLKEAATTDAMVARNKLVSPPKPPKSTARGVPRYGVGNADIRFSAAVSPLPISIAGRSPQTPPRTTAATAGQEPASRPEYPYTMVPSSSTDSLGREPAKVSASGVPKAPGGFGLGLNFAESPSPTAKRYPAARNTSHRAAAAAAAAASPISVMANNPILAVDDEPEWVGVAM
ncbi:hypothetical protein BCV70DRAFT_201023 [Testicularia cyperi]|uniref:Uncharacterized protein n=1 Tax=Testicularia cyperi TaxID=1882483 RepID=A0A317XMC2_9BASI|nr:hypothetical protein BCV70DRAFT_201023 [Testicularia cyperi]